MCSCLYLIEFAQQRVDVVVGSGTMTARVPVRVTLRHGQGIALPVCTGATSCDAHDWRTSVTAMFEHACLMKTPMVDMSDVPD